MNIAIDTSPLQSGHKVRGVGFYLKHLIDGLQKYDSKNTYSLFSTSIPSGIDLVHYPYFDPFFLTLPFKKKYKTVVTVHDLTPLVLKGLFPSGVKGKIKWLIQRNRLQHVDAIIADSEASKKDIIRLVDIPESKVYVVYLAPGEQFKKVVGHKLQAVREKYQLPEKFALYVGDVTPNKNLPRLLEAIQNTSIPLVLCGKAITETHFDNSNPWNRDRVEVQKMIKNNKNILALGFVPDEDLVLLYNLATLVVVPSLYEGFGLPVVEAFACGTPVITTKEGSLAEVAGDAAYFVNPYDSNSLAEGIQKVFSETKLQNQLSRKGLEQVKKFTWEKTAKQTIHIYETVYKK